MPVSAQNLKAKALELGFNLVGITRAEPSPTLNAYLDWVGQEMHAKMGYLARPDRVIRRENPQVILPQAQSFVVVAFDFHQTHELESMLNNPTRGRIARYAWGMDYHDIMIPRLESLAEWLHAEAESTLKHRVYVDTGAILERSHAQQAGLGFIGKNTMLIHPKRGSSSFIGEILTTFDFDEYDTPHRETMCGSCTRCLMSCPTDALPTPYTLDARRCISYHMIENKGWIDRELRADFGNWVYGCDICQDVCPFQRFITPTTESRFTPRHEYTVAPRLADLLQITDEQFYDWYHDSPIYRIKRERLIRNALICAGNSGDDSLAPLIEAYISDDSPLLRGHAIWALSQIYPNLSQTISNRIQNLETDPLVLAEYEATLT